MTRNISEMKAKQGRSGRQVLTILIAALVLVVIGWFFVESYGQSIDPDKGTQTRIAPSQSDQPAAAAPSQAEAPAGQAVKPTQPATSAPAVAPAAGETSGAPAQ